MVPVVGCDGFCGERVLSLSLYVPSHFEEKGKWREARLGNMDSGPIIEQIGGAKSRGRSPEEALTGFGTHSPKPSLHKEPQSGVSPTLLCSLEKSLSLRSLFKL